MTSASAPRYARGKDALRKGLAKSLLDNLLIPRHLTASEWAEEHGYLSPESSAETGRIRLYGYQRGLLDAFSDPSLVQVTVLKAARVGYTRMLDLAIGYFIHHDPCPILLVQPTAGDAEDYSAKEIKPMLRDTAALSALVREPGRGEAQDRACDMLFRNGASLALRGAASDDAFRRLTTRINMADELDAAGWASNGKEGAGNKLALLEKRGETFWNSKLIVGSTPKIEESSKVWAEWLKSDQRRYFVPCPRCTEAAGGELSGWQYLKWGSPDVDHGVKWKRGEDGEVLDVWYVCEVCGCRIEQHEKRWMDANGTWKPTAKPKRRGHAGFHLWSGMSLFVKADWALLVERWISAQARPHEELKPFFNETLGLPWKDIGGTKPDPTGLMKRREVYSHAVPDGVVLLTAGFDFQGPGANARIEYEIVGWGRHEESWQIEYGVINLDPGTPEAKRAILKVLARAYTKANGQQLRIKAAALDCGGGYSNEYFEWCAQYDRRPATFVFPVKGGPNRERKPSVWPAKVSATKNGYKVHVLDTQLAKDILMRALKIEQPGPGYCHFPMAADDEYFAGLTAEECEVEWIKGQPIPVWGNKKRRRNEPLDCRVYAYASLKGLKSVDPSISLERLADRMGIAAWAPPAMGAEIAVEAAPSPATEPQAPAPAVAASVDPPMPVAAAGDSPGRMKDHEGYKVPEALSSPRAEQPRHTPKARVAAPPAAPVSPQPYGVRYRMKGLR